MATDEEYMAFLNKANQDLSAGMSATSSTQRRQFKATDEGHDVPQVIQDVCRKEVYVSDADEPFEAVSLKWDGNNGLPDEGKITHSVSDRASASSFCGRAILRLDFFGLLHKTH